MSGVARSIGKHMLSIRETDDFSKRGGDGCGFGVGLDIMNVGKRDIKSFAHFFGEKSKGKEVRIWLASETTVGDRGIALDPEGLVEGAHFGVF